MDFSKLIEEGVKETPQITVLMSEPGKGKTTFASKYPFPLFADIENGSRKLNVKRFGSDKIPNYEKLLALIEWCEADDHPFKTLVIDSTTALENYIHRSICGKKYESIEDIPFGKGFMMAREEMQKLMQKLRNLSERMDIVICAHTTKKRFTDPITNNSYDRYVIQMDEKSAQILMSGADNVFFIKDEVDAVVDDRTKKTQAFSTGKRLLMTEWSHAYDAKNRLNLPSQLPLDYQALSKAIRDNKLKSADELIEDIKHLASKIQPQDAEIARTKVQEANGDPETLLRIKQKLLTMVTT